VSGLKYAHEAIVLDAQTKSSDFIVLEHDVEYVRRGDMPLHLNILFPADKDETTPWPVVVFVQGSAWGKQDIFRNIPSVLKLAACGYVVAMAEYRPSSVSLFPAQVQDVKTAIRYMRINAAKYNGDPERIAVFGDSSGGHTAAMVCITQGMEEFDTPEYAEVSADVLAAVDHYGPTDILRMDDFECAFSHDAADSPESRLIGCPIQQNREKAKKVDPAVYVSPQRKIAPLLIMHGDEDELVPYNQSELLYDALREAGKDVAFYRVAGGHHGGAKFWCPQAVDIVDEFLKKHLKK